MKSIHDRHYRKKLQEQSMASLTLKQLEDVLFKIMCDFPELDESVLSESALRETLR